VLSFNNLLIQLGLVINYNVPMFHTLFIFVADKHVHKTAYYIKLKISIINYYCIILYYNIYFLENFLQFFNSLQFTTLSTLKLYNNNI